MVQRRSSAALVLAAAAWSGACGGGSAPELPEAPPPRDLAMLELMMRINSPYLGMQPHLRDVNALEDLASSADLIAEACEDPVFVGWTAREDFDRDPTTWEASHGDLLSGAREAADAARAGDLDALHHAYGVMSRSCTACHKRYSPHQ